MSDYPFIRKPFDILLVQAIYLKEESSQDCNLKVQESGPRGLSPPISVTQVGHHDFKSPGSRTASYKEDIIILKLSSKTLGYEVGRTF